MTIEEAITKLKESRKKLPRFFTENQKRLYLAGYIDALEESGAITPEERNGLYAEWGP